MSHNAKVWTHQELKTQILNFGVLMMTEGMDLQTNASLGNRSHMLEESRILNASTEKILKDK